MIEFVELTDENYKEKLTESKFALIDFYASWCGMCRMMAPAIKRVANEFNMALFKIDAEQNAQARGLTEIKNLPTMALWRDGKIVDSISTTKEETLRNFIQSHQTP